MTATDARDDLKDKAADILAAWDADALTPKTLFRVAGQQWLAWFRREGSDAQTIQRYEPTLMRTLDRSIGALTLGELSNSLLRKTLRSIKDAGHLSEARVARVVIRHVLAHAAEHGAVSPELFNFDGLRMPVPKKTPRAITEEELARLRLLIDRDRAAAETRPWGTKSIDDLGDVLDMILATSLRISEVLAIHRADFDPIKGLLTIHTHVEYEKGKGYQLGTVKTDSTARVITLPQFAVLILESRFEKYDEIAFPNARGGYLSQNNLRRTLRSITDDTEFEEWFTPHTGRKTVATIVRAAHGSDVAAAVLGHSNNALIDSTYAQALPLAPDVTNLTEKYGRRVDSTPPSSS